MKSKYITGIIKNTVLGLLGIFLIGWGYLTNKKHETIKEQNQEQQQNSGTQLETDSPEESSGSL